MKNGVIKGIGPDGKAQVTVEYEDDTPKRIKTIVVSVQHRADKDLEVLRSEIIYQVLWPVFEKFPFDDDTEILINPSGRFVEGGPAADTGLTGRKIMVDSYGGLAAHGGGAFSGKDPTKVDRSGAYMARAIAKNIVWCGYAKRCQLAISYAIGKADPVAVEIETFGTGTVSDEVLRKAVLEVFNLRPAAIIETLSLRDAIYADTATYGHFSGTLYRWEWLDRYKELQEAVKKYAD
jgi:S-adenosylmethionine synthetase